MTRLKHRVFAAGLAGIAAARADRWLGPLAQGRGLVLMFHRVRPSQKVEFAPNCALEITPEFLDAVLTELRREGFDVVPVAAIPDRLRGDRRDRPFAALTFDDGYRDNVQHAWPILKRHAMPWTIFVTVEFADGRGSLWWLELEEAIARLDRVTLSGDSRPASLSTRSAREKQAAFDAIYRDLRAGPQRRLRAVLADLTAQAGIASTRIAADHCLSWDELRALARDPDVTIGAHTLSHPLLAQLDKTAAAREIAEGKAVLERRLGRPIRHLAYPFGDRAAAGAREFGLSRQAGFATAMTSRPGHLFSAHAAHLTALPRVSINGLFQSTRALRVLLSGVPFLLWYCGRVANTEAQLRDVVHFQRLSPQQ